MTTLVDNRYVAQSFEHPRPPKISTPSIDQKLAEADAAAQRASAAAAEESQARHAALCISTKIEALKAKLTDLRNHLDGVEQRDLKAQLEQCRVIFRTLFGKPALSPIERGNLNEAGNALGWIPAAILEVPALKKDLKAQIAEVEKEIAALEGK